METGRSALVLTGLLFASGQRFVVFLREVMLQDPDVGGFVLLFEQP